MAEEVVKKELQEGARIHVPSYQSITLSNLAWGAFAGALLGFVVWRLLLALYAALGVSGGALLFILQALALAVAAALAVVLTAKVATRTTVMYIRSDPPDDDDDDEEKSP